MRRLTPFFAIGLCFIGILLIAACAPGGNLSTVQSSEAAPVVEVAAAADVLISDNSTVLESNPASNPVAEPAAIIQASSSCLECHSNAELLEQLGEEKEIPKVPSEGSG